MQATDHLRIASSHRLNRALVSIELRRLRYAEVAERCGSFRKAADLLGLKQSISAEESESFRGVRKMALR